MSRKLFSTVILFHSQQIQLFPLLSLGKQLVKRLISIKRLSEKNNEINKNNADHILRLLPNRRAGQEFGSASIPHPKTAGERCPEAVTPKKREFWGVLKPPQQRRSWFCSWSGARSSKCSWIGKSRAEQWENEGKSSL